MQVLTQPGFGWHLGTHWLSQPQATEGTGQLKPLGSFHLKDSVLWLQATYSYAGGLSFNTKKCRTVHKGLLVFVNLVVLFENLIHFFQVGVYWHNTKCKGYKNLQSSVSPPISNPLTLTVTPPATTVSNFSCILSGNSMYIQVHVCVSVYFLLH